MVLAVDFDGTIVKDEFPAIGEADEHMLSLLKVLKQQGHQLILWTCRRDDRLAEAVTWCSERGLHFDAVNANLPDNIIKYGGDTRKVSADIYIDDKNGFLSEVIKIVQEGVVKCGTWVENPDNPSRL